MIDINKVQQGEMISFTQYVTVESVNKIDNSMIVTTRNGKRLVYNGNEGLEDCSSAIQFNETKKLGKNALAEILELAKDKVFTVNYKKLDGSLRTLTGRYLYKEPNLGRTAVVDLNIPSTDPSKGIRQVDNREIISIILDNVKYVAQ